MDIAAIAGTALGLAFVYLLLSLVCSTIQEWIAGLLRRRAANLREGLLALLNDDKSAIDALFSDPMLQSMMARGIFSNKPRPKSLAYLPADRFSNALLKQFAATALQPGTNLIAEIQTMPAGKLRESLLVLAQRAEGKRDRFFELVHKWYDDTMERVTGWYKREAQLVIIAISVFVTLFANVDTVRVIQKLYTDPVARERVAAMADQWLAANPPQQGTNTSKTDEQLRADYAAHMATLGDLDLPLWWNASSFGEWTGEFRKAFPTSWPGWLLTIIAVSLGAPFWFEVLMKVANLRANGPKPPRQSER